MENGNVTAVAQGVATITVTTVDGDFTSTASVTVSQSVMEITVTSGTMEVFVGSTLQLSASVLPVDATDPSIAWSVEEGDAVIDADGLLLAGYTPGPVTVRAAAGDGSQVFGELTITVIPDQIIGITDPEAMEVIYHNDINFPSTVSVSLESGGTTQVSVSWNDGAYDDGLGKYAFIGTPVNLPQGILNEGHHTARVLVTFVPDQVIGVTPVEMSILCGESPALPLEVGAQMESGRAANINVDWDLDSFDGSPGVHSITGLLKELPFGIANANGVTVSADITVIQPVSGVTIAPNSVDMEVGETAPLTATVLPVNAFNKAVTWSSSDDSIATVDAEGLVTAVGAGTATIIVLTEDGHFAASSTVVVSHGSAELTGINVELGYQVLVFEWWENANLNFSPGQTSYTVGAGLARKAKITPSAGSAATIYYNGQPSTGAITVSRDGIFDDKDVVIITVSEPGKTDTVYTVVIDW